MSNAQLITHTEFVELLKSKKGDRSLRDFAAEFNISHQYLAKVLAGDVEAGPAIADVLGYEPVAAFRRKPRERKPAAAKTQAVPFHSPGDASLPRCTALHSRTRRKCVKPSGHPSNEHEDLEGNKWETQPRARAARA